MKCSPCLCTNLRQAAQASTALYDEALAPSGLKITMYRLLRNIDDMGCPSISELARQVGLERSTLGRNLRVLEREDLVRLQTAEDRRERGIALTAKGSAALASAKPLWSKAQQTMRQLLGDKAELLFELANDLNQLRSL
ncbi:MAG: MarR family transcriptional regulator [Candidatus Competibacteraceae bacterium]|jgi:DNA-binding MarR family transcriptional regulator|nr:MarR family transcriptional regulator [Candidatus Competibacteraceae bacterium]